MSTRVDYIRHFFKSPRSFGTVAPSSRSLCSAMISGVDFSRDVRVAELGAGDGVLTRRILEVMSCSSRLDAYEIEDSLVCGLLKLDDKRLNVISGSAEHMDSGYDAVMSCLPLTSLSRSTRVNILQRCYDSLSCDGVFIQFQYSRLCESWFRGLFVWHRKLVLMNIPPAFVYFCKKDLGRSFSSET